MDWRARDFGETEMRTRFIPVFLCPMAATALFVWGIFEISFPEKFSLANFDAISNKFPDAWKYNVHTGIAVTILSALLIVPAWLMNKNSTGSILEFLIRVGIGGMFIFASYYKIISPKEFAVAVAQYQFLPNNLVNAWALILPQFEFWFGLALIITPFVRECTLVILGMFACFMVALAWALALDLDIVCGCFSIEGAQSKSEAWITLIRDLVLLWPTAWLLTRKNKNLIRTLTES
jgi:hypothetical protein